MCVAAPYGARPLVYADYTASGRSLACIESRIQHHVLPFYANTHTDASLTGRTTSRLREEARSTILAACGGNPADHAVIFTGSGSTSAIATMIAILQLQSPARKRQGKPALKRKRRPVVFISSMEHHSNEVSWRETKADVVRVPMNESGQPCLVALAKVRTCASDGHAERCSLSVSVPAAGQVPEATAAGWLVYSGFQRHRCVARGYVPVTSHSVGYRGHHASHSASSVPAPPRGSGLL